LVYWGKKLFRKISRLYKTSIIILIAIIGLSISLDFKLHPGRYENYSAFTIELNCTLPTPLEKMNIISVGNGTATEAEIIELAESLFQMNNITKNYEDNSIILRSGEKSLRYYQTDYIKYRDRAYDRDEIVEGNKTLLTQLSSEFLDSLDEYWKLPPGDDVRFERMEFHDYSRRGAGFVASQPWYVNYRHYLNGTPVLALNAEFNLGFADGRIVYADISRINTASISDVTIFKTPMDAIQEAFPGAIFASGKGVGSFAAFPVSGRIIIEDFRIMHYNWHGPDSRPVGKTYDLYPYYRFDALVVGPDSSGIMQCVRLNLEISARN